MKRADVRDNKEEYLEHQLWLKKEEKLLSIAKKIYSKCKCSKKSKDIAKLNDEVYDLMCEHCWEKFRKEE